LDLAVAGYQLQILLGNGDGTFHLAGTYAPTVYYPYDAVAVADLDLDGNPDVVLASLGPLGYAGCDVVTSDPSIVVLMGNGDGTFQNASAVGTGCFISVSVADVNLDGKLDIVGSRTGLESGQVVVWLGVGGGTFQAPIEVPAYNVAASSFAVGDLDGDGRPDIAEMHTVATDQSFVAFFHGNGDGTFAAAVDYAVVRDSDPVDPLSVLALDTAAGPSLVVGDTWLGHASAGAALDIVPSECFR
jgi:hypothetical protein